MAAWRFTSEDKPQGSFVLIDPAGTKDATMLQSDFLKYMMLFPHYEKLMKEITLQEKQFKRALLLCLRHGCSLIGVESNAYQATLAYWINIIFQQYGVGGIEVVEIHSECTPKTVEFLKLCVN